MPGYRKRAKESWTARKNFLERIDMFGMRLPQFNLKGNSLIHTRTGGVLTFFLVVLMLSYGLIKFIHLLSKHNPQIQQFLDEELFDFTEILNLNEIKFRVAFSVEGYHDRNMKNDPRYTKFLVRTFGRRGG